MPSKEAIEHYNERFVYCSHKAMQHNGDSGYWIHAAEVYEHLMVCDKSHTYKNKSTPACNWGNNGTYERKL